MDIIRSPAVVHFEDIWLYKPGCCVCPARTFISPGLQSLRLDCTHWISVTWVMTRFLSIARPAIQVSDCNPHTIKILDCTRITRIQNTWLQGFKMGSLSRRELSVTQSRLSTLWNFLVRLLRFTPHNLFLHLHASQCSCQNDDHKSKIICKHNILHRKHQQLIWLIGAHFKVLVNCVHPKDVPKNSSN